MSQPLYLFIEKQQERFPDRHAAGAAGEVIFFLRSFLLYSAPQVAVSIIVGRPASVHIRR
ncbi:hypothetical protein ALCH109712_01540 [Alkalicoccus chagannorensis]